jgi:hypothetical protein
MAILVGQMNFRGQVSTILQFMGLDQVEVALIPGVEMVLKVEELPMLVREELILVAGGKVVGGVLQLMVLYIHHHWDQGVVHRQMIRGLILEVMVVVL